LSAVAALATVAALTLSACGSNNTNPTDTGAELTAVDLVLDWTPNTNHTGLYVARENGYFAAQGLDVNIIQPPEDGAEALVGAGRAQFGVSYQENVTQARQAEVPIVSIAAVLAHNTSGFASPVDRGLENPKDYEGHTYGGWGSPIEAAILNAVVVADGGDPTKVKNLNIGTTSAIQAFQRDIDVAWLYEGWDVVQANLEGQELNFELLRTYDPVLDWYTPVLTTNETTIANDPELVQKFINAVTEGYEYTIENPLEAADILLTSVPDLDADTVRASQEYLADKYQDDSPVWGYQDQDIWKNFSAWLEANEIIEPGFDWQAAYTNEFVEAVPANEEATE
jgi:ABC-type nitrate/sulfonate/bicarbonate transport system substrate-binding protein